MKVLKNRIFIIGAGIIFILLPILFNIFLPHNKIQPQADKGIIDLTKLDFKKDGVVSLDGEWEFYWNQLLTEDDFMEGKSIKPDGYFKVPSVWNNYPVNNMKFPEKGYATYRLKVKTNNIDLLKGLKILTASTSYKLMIDNQVVAQNGVVGKTKEEAVPEFKPQAVSFRNASKDFNIIIQVSNFAYSRGGMWHSIYLGSDQEIRELKEFDSAKAMFMLGVVVIMSLYHFALFIIQRRDKSALYFAIALLVTAIRTTITGEYIILNFMPSAKITWMVPLEYMTMYWGLIMAIAFVGELYPKEISKKVKRSSIYAGIIISIFTIFAPISIFTRYLIFYEILIAMLYGYITFSVMKAVLKRREGALLLLIGSIIILAAFINDVLYYWNVTYDKYGPSMEVAVFIVTFIQAYILASRFSLAFKKVEKLSERLISLDKLKDDFLVNATHELTTQLNGNINIIQSLLKGVAGKLNLKQEENLQVVLASSRRLYNLINDIMDISNLAYDELKLYPKPVDIRMIMESIIFVLEYLKGEKNIVFENLIEKDVPAVFCDEERLGQIFYNVLENALKFIDRGKIKVKAEFLEDIATIFIENEGLEIKEDNLNNGINYSKTVNSFANSKHEGSSLGLSIAKQLIELQGGNIIVNSQYAKEPSFSFTLPLAKGYSKKAARKIEGPSLVQNTQVEDINDVKVKNVDKYNILAIEYDTLSLKVLINNLNLYGYTVRGIRNGYDALKLLENGIKFDVVILNIMMPGISGYDILKKIREKYLPVELPVLLLTSSKRTYEISAGFRLGANDYLTKPFESEELNARVKSLINMKKAVNKLVAAELSFLQAQIKPHFIYNALSVISSLSIVDPAKAKELILDLSDYLRGSFDFESKNGLTTLKRELHLVKAYLAIEQARFKERICVEFEVDDLVECTIPMLCIQPLVENAVRHGIMPIIDGGKIEVAVKNKGEYIKISISDNGVGINEEKLKNILLGKLENGSVGIKNIHRRLMKLYGKGIIVKRREGNGTIVEFEVPYS